MYGPNGGSGWGYQPIPEHIPFGRPILYSTGDFVDDYAVDEIERNDESFIFVVETSSYRVTGLRLYPTVICQRLLSFVACNVCSFSPLSV